MEIRKKIKAIEPLGFMPTEISIQVNGNVTIHPTAEQVRQAEIDDTPAPDPYDLLSLTIKLTQHLTNGTITQDTTDLYPLAFREVLTGQIDTETLEPIIDNDKLNAILSAYGLELETN